MTFILLFRFNKSNGFNSPKRGAAWSLFEKSFPQSNRLIRNPPASGSHLMRLYSPLCGIFRLHSVDVARCAALIQTKSPTNCGAHLAESIFQTRSKRLPGIRKEALRESAVHPQCRRAYRVRWKCARSGLRCC